MTLVVLPLYDLPETRAAYDRFWAAVRGRLEAAGMNDLPPAALPPVTLPGTPDRPADPRAAWLDPDLLLAQADAYAVTAMPAGRVRLVATPRYRTSGGSGARHRSFILVPRDAAAHRVIDLRGSRCAVDAWDSNTGMNLLRAAVAPLARDGRFFAGVTVTGSQTASLEAVATGTADTAAIDCVNHALLSRHRAELVDRTRVLAVTAATPCPPFITSANTGDAMLDTLRAALRETVEADLESLRADLLLDGFDLLPERAYRVVRRLEDQAAKLGYPVLA